MTMVILGFYVLAFSVFVFTLGEKGRIDTWRIHRMADHQHEYLGRFLVPGKCYCGLAFVHQHHVEAKAVQA